MPVFCYVGLTGSNEYSAGNNCICAYYEKYWIIFPIAIDFFVTAML